MSNGGSDQKLQLVIDRLQAEVAALHQSRRRVVEAASADRRALERALHEGVQQRLVALAVDLQHLAAMQGRDAASAKALVEEISGNLREALSEAAALAHQIYPPFLDGLGLASSLRSAAASAGVTVMVDVPAGAEYSPEVGAAIYWSCAEMLASAPPGSHATVDVRDAEGGVTFAVAADGRQSAAFEERLRDRLEAFGGRLTVDDENDAWRVQGWLPLSG